MERARKSFSEGLKRGLVDEIESGHQSIRDAAYASGAGITQIQKWLDEYGRFKPKRDVLEVVMKSEQEKIGELEKALAEAHLKLRVYDKIISLADKQYKVDLKKTFGTEQPESFVKREKEQISKGSPERSGTAVTRTTSVKKGGVERRSKSQ